MSDIEHALIYVARLLTEEGISQQQRAELILALSHLIEVWMRHREGG